MKFKHLFQLTAALFLAGMMMFTFTACGDDDDGVDPDPTPSSAKEILTFVVDGVNGNISGTNITANLSFDADVTSLAPTITVSEGATVSPASGAAQDFSSPVTYTVTAEDGSTQNYTATITQDDPPQLTVTALWERNLANGNLPDWFQPNNDRDIAAYGDFVYVHNNNDRIRVVSAADGTDVTAGADGFMDGKENFVSGDIFLLGTATDNQGKIIASNLRVGSANQHPWNVYKWNDKDAEQELLFAYPTPAGFRLGENLSVTGDVSGNAQIYVPGGGFATQNNKVLKFSITDGEANLTPMVIELEGITVMGNAPDVWPVSDAADANIIVAGTGVGGIAEYTQTGTLVGKLPTSLNDGIGALLFTFALDVCTFEIAGKRILAATATDFTAGADPAGFLYLVDITDGWDNVTVDNISRVPFTPEDNIDPNGNGTGGVVASVNGDTATVYAMITNYGIGAYKVTFE